MIKKHPSLPGAFSTPILGLVHLLCFEQRVFFIAGLFYPAGVLWVCGSAALRLCCVSTGLRVGGDAELRGCVFAGLRVCCVSAAGVLRVCCGSEAGMLRV